jgi:hypothetical protein
VKTIHGAEIKERGRPGIIKVTKQTLSFSRKMEYDGVSKSFGTGLLEGELKMV